MDNQEAQDLIDLLSVLNSTYEYSIKDYESTKETVILEKVSTKIVAVLNLLEVPGEEELITQREEDIKKTKEKEQRIKSFINGK